MAFFNQAVNVMGTVVVGLGGGLGVWGIINLLEGYGNDNPGAKSQGIKQLMAGGGIVIVGTTLIPLLASVFG
ncbi:conjugal transfer protein [Mediterraneibacter gnavus]|uniref:Conjugal transfer protein n=1 Tax=Mediterraneibacter gnavus TaxID=33038 RepID=A0A415S3D7_MEDGN|nr:Maff2 family protein [Mediterraneibacter gnavus]RHM69843.1 conjugal transfer protein [Mediterraneibacter gnavus]